MKTSLQYNVRTEVFTLRTLDAEGLEHVELFTAPGTPPFNVYGVDVCALRDELRNHEAALATRNQNRRGQNNRDAIKCSLHLN